MKRGPKIQVVNLNARNNIWRVLALFCIASMLRQGSFSQGIAGESTVNTGGIAGFMLNVATAHARVEMARIISIKGREEAIEACSTTLSVDKHFECPHLKVGLYLVSLTNQIGAFRRPLFYPGTYSLSQSRLVKVQEGITEDIRFGPEDVQCGEAVITFEEGSKNMQVSISSTKGDDPAFEVPFAAEEITSSELVRAIKELPFGDYIVRADWALRNIDEHAVQSLAVRSSRPVEISVVDESRETISGSVSGEQGIKIPKYVDLIPQTASAHGLRVKVNAEGEFHSADVIAGSYSLGLPEGDNRSILLQSPISNEVESASSPQFNVEHGSSLRLVASIKDGSGSVRGQLAGQFLDKSQMVMLFGIRTKTTRTLLVESREDFSFVGLPDDDYSIVAWSLDDEPPYRNTATMEQLIGMGEHIDQASLFTGQVVAVPTIKLALPW